MTINQQVKADALGSVTDAMFLFEVAEGPEGVEFRCVMANPAALDSTGFSEEDVLGKTLPEIVSEDLATVTAEKFGQVIETGRPVQWELTVDLPAGDNLVFEISNSPLLREGRCTHIVTLSHEVTANRELLRELQQGEERFRNLFERSPLALQRLDCSGVGNWLDSVRESGTEDLRTYLAAHPSEVLRGIGLIRILDVNSAGVELYEADNKEQLTGAPKEHRTEGVLESYVERFVAIWDGSESLHTQLTATTFKGNAIKCILHWSAPVVDGELDLTKGVLALTDLTDLTAALEQSGRVRDEFLAGMSHELRTPLNTIMGLASILERRTFGPLNDKQHQYIDEITKSSQHLLSLINDVLDLQKIDAVQEELEIDSIDLPALIEGVVTMLREAATAKGIKVHQSGVPESLVVSGDERRLKQVLVNLLSNAVKFTPEDGVVGVEVEHTDGHVHVTVWDRGVGIPERHLQLLFRPFTQIDATLTREQEGSGLGLALSQRLMALHGGTITVESTEGKGSRFVMHWPTNPPGTRSAAIEQVSQTTLPAVPPRSSSQEVTVLVVEDNPVNRMMLVDHLVSQNFTVHVAEDGFEMIEQATAVLPDVILMDIQLPRMDGLTATRLLQLNAATQGIPCVALTALAMRGDRERCLEAGCVAYLDKPLNLDEVVDLIEKLTSTAHDEASLSAKT
ncbi:MAG: response regulator [Acidobacteria bacterium]|nr:response regulator [Acidobacteriota bacterium]